MYYNFVNRFENLNKENVMGIYGASHIELNDNEFKSFGVRLKEKYSNKILLIDLTDSVFLTKPIRIDKIVLNKEKYLAEYYG